MGYPSNSCLPVKSLYPLATTRSMLRRQRPYVSPHLRQLIKSGTADFVRMLRFSPELNSFSHNSHFLYRTISLALNPKKEAMFVSPMVLIRLYKTWVSFFLKHASMSSLRRFPRYKNCVLEKRPRPVATGKHVQFRRKIWIHRTHIGSIIRKYPPPIEITCPAEINNRLGEKF